MSSELLLMLCVLTLMIAALTGFCLASEKVRKQLPTHSLKFTLTLLRLRCIGWLLVCSACGVAVAFKGLGIGLVLLVGSATAATIITQSVVIYRLHWLTAVGLLAGFTALLLVAVAGSWPSVFGFVWPFVSYVKSR